MIPLTTYTLLLAQILAHLSVIPMIIWGTWWHWVITIFVYFLSGCLGMTMTYHRLLSHKSWICPRWMEKLFVGFATIGMTGSAISWVAIHRKHHAFVDTKRDPHSPKYLGWFWTHFLSMYALVEIKYARHLLRDNFYHFQHRQYFTINIIYALILYILDPFALIYAWLVPAMILWNAGSVIVSTSHRNGKPHNDLIFALSVWGEGYHENHHQNVKSKRFGKYDLGGIIISLLEKLCNPKILKS